MALELIDSDIDRDEKGWIETTIYKAYSLDRETGDVVYTESISCDNPYKPHKNCDNKEMVRIVLNSDQIPPHIRAKVKELMKVAK